MKRIIISLLTIVFALTVFTGNSMNVGAEESESEITYNNVSFEYVFDVKDEWENHFNSEITLKNTDNSEIHNWELAFEYEGEIENIWNAKIVSHYENIYVIKNAGWNQDIGIGKEVVFGFTVSYDDEKPKEPYNLSMQRVSEEVIDGCNIEFKQFTQYENKIQGQIEITNTSDNYIEDWSFDFESNFEIIDIWNAEICEQNQEREGDNVTGIHYSLNNKGYNQSIEPGQTINFGMIGILLEGSEGIVENETLYHLTTYPYDEQDELDEDDCIWEGDIVEDDMSVVYDEILDEDDYDRMEEELLASEPDNAGYVKLYSKARTAGVTTFSAETGKKAGDKISYYVYGLPHKRQVQTWCQFVYKNENTDNVKVIFVAQNDDAGNAVISLCEEDENGDYKYSSEIQIKKTGHTQSLYCQAKKGSKFYLYTNCHGVKFKGKEDKETVWGTRFARVIFDTEKNGVNKNGKNAENIVDMTTDTEKMNLECTIKGDSLKYFKAVAFSRKEKSLLQEQAVARVLLS